MDMNQTTPPRKLRGLGKSLSVAKTPPNPQSPIEERRENTAPSPSKLPKAFNFTERYMSPTDRIISPVSRGLLARNRKIDVLFPPTKTPSKTMVTCLKDARPFQI